MDNRLLEKEKKAYVSLYKKDVLPYSLILCAILAELIYDIMVLDVMPVNYLMGITVMVNIAILFLLFTCARKGQYLSQRMGGHRCFFLAFIC